MAQDVCSQYLLLMGLGLSATAPFPFNRTRRRPHQQDSIPELDGFIHIVRHDQHASAGLMCDAQQQVLHLGPGDRIKSAEGFIQQQEPWVSNQHPGQGDALSHAAGQMGRGCLRMTVKPHQLQRPLNAFASLVRAQTFGMSQGQAELDIAANGEPGQKCRLLKDKPQP